MKKGKKLVAAIMNIIAICSLSMCGEMALTGCSLNQPMPNNPQNRTPPQNRPPVPTDPNQVLLRMMQQKSLDKAMNSWANPATQTNPVQQQIQQQQKQITALIMVMKSQNTVQQQSTNQAGQCKMKQVDALFTGYDTNYQFE